MSTSARPAISSAITGAEVGPRAATVDARWVMAYAAGLGVSDPRYYDTRRRGGPVAHPLFPVCYEWPLALELRAKTIAGAVANRSVHATHHLMIHRPPRAGDTLLTSAMVVGVERRRAGTLVTTRFTTVDERGAPVTTTRYGSVYRGVDCDRDAAVEPASLGAWTTRRGHRNDDHPAHPGAPAASLAPAWVDDVPVPAWAAHVYTECARIWNPIHTDIAVAAAAGLPGLILHGTATLALATSCVLAHEAGGDPALAREIAGRFTGMVAMPSRLRVRGTAPAGTRVARFDALGVEDRPVLDGWIALSPHEEPHP